MNANSGSETSVKFSSPRAPYKSPTIVEYGTLREVTLTLGNNGNPDGPLGGSKDRTKV